MRDLGTMIIPIAGIPPDTKLRVWETGDPIPAFGKSVGVDTETELITDTDYAPPLVVIGVYSPKDNTCYYATWQHASNFITALCTANTEQRYFNIGFDIPVMERHCQQDNAKAYQALMLAVDKKRCIDMQIRVLLNDLKTEGFTKYSHFSLAGCADMLFNYKMDKGDGTEDSVRMSFHKYNKDGTPADISDEHMRYLAIDCAVTWLIGEAVEHAATEEVHSQGSIVLAHIRNNGFPVDMEVFNSLKEDLVRERDAQRDKLVEFGFPDPYKQYEQIKEQEFQRARAKLGEYETAKDKRLLVTLVKFADNIPELEADIDFLRDKKLPGLRKKEDAVYREVISDIPACILRRPPVLHILLNRTYEAITQGATFADALKSSLEFIDQYPQWTGEKCVGPKEFFLNRVNLTLERHPELELERTAKNNDPQLTKKDIWRLQDCGVEDAFLPAYTNFNHCQKYLSTYMNEEFIKADGKVHPRFTPLLRTGRTSCAAMNTQNLPSRDKLFPLKNMFSAPPGAILCATDYSFVESARPN